MKYAEKTTVPVEKSKAEIEKLLSRYGADQFMSGWDQKKAFIVFRMANRHIKIVITLPDLNSEKFVKTPAGRKRRHLDSQLKAHEQACRQRWRSLLLRIKAKLEAIASGDADFESEFMADIMLPDGKTVGEYLKPEIKAAYETGKMQKLIPRFTD